MQCGRGAMSTVKRDHAPCMAMASPHAAHDEDHDVDVDADADDDDHPEHNERIKNRL